MPIEPLIQVENLSITLGKHKILEQVSFKIDAGEYIGIVGPNGGGKTTLLKAMLGLIPLTQGKIRLPRELTAYVPQFFSGNLFPFPMSVEEVLATGLRGKKVGYLDKGDHKAIDEALRMVASQNLKKRLFSNLSGGQRQRVIIARAMVASPRILILDEPLSAVDIPSQKNFYSLLSDLNKKELLTVIMATHDIDMVAAETSRVLCLNQKLHASCHPEELMTQQWLQTFGEQFKPVHHHKHHA